MRTSRERTETAAIRSAVLPRFGSDLKLHHLSARSPAPTSTAPLTSSSPQAPAGHGPVPIIQPYRTPSP